MTDLIPAARPVPSTEDRMREARTDTPPTTDPAPTHPGRSFRTWMSDTDRDQLDAEVGRLQGELDEMRDARDVAKQLADFRQGVIDRHRQELGAAGDVLAVVRDAAERIDRALAVYDTTDVAAPASEIDRDGIKRHLVRTGLDGAVAEVERLTTERNQLVETIGRLVSLPPEQIAEIHKVGYSGSAPSSVPPRRAQEEPLTAAQLGEMSIQANVEQVQAIHHHARGYADAIAALRDDSRYMDWWSSTGVKPAGPLRQHLADYLETVGPDGPDVTTPSQARP